MRSRCRLRAGLQYRSFDGSAVEVGSTDALGSMAEHGGMARESKKGLQDVLEQGGGLFAQEQLAQMRSELQAGFST